MKYAPSKHRKLLLSGQMVEAGFPDKRNFKIKTLSYFGVQGAYKGSLKFTEEDIPAIIATLKEALEIGKTV